jgi:hypothetical protein
LKSVREALPAYHIAHFFLAMQKDGVKTAAKAAGKGARASEKAEAIAAACAQADASDPASSVVIATNICTRCEKNFVAPDSRCCSDCNKLAVRISRLSSNRPEESAKFKDLSKSEKVEFMSANHDKLGKDLAASFMQYVEERKEIAHRTTMQGTGDWMDDADLKSFFKDKPEQYEAVKRNSVPMWDTLRECYLWQKMTFQTTNVDSEERVRMEKRTMEATLMLKKESKPKKPKLGAEGAVVDTELTPSQKEKLGKLIVSIRTTEATMAGMTDTFEKPQYIPYLAPMLKNNLAMNIADLKSQEAMLTITSEAGKVNGLFATTVAAAQDVMKTGDKLQKTIAHAIKGADAAIKKNA